jgi:class 3 adenylate cyclase
VPSRDRLADEQHVLTTAEWRELVLDAERRGEVLSAVDVAERGLEQHPEDLWLRHRAVLALARSGSTGEAARRFTEYELDRVAGNEDIGALAARIAKDEALAAGDEQMAQAAADAYAAVYSRTRGYYPAVNAATLYLVAGSKDEAEKLAAEVLALLGESGNGSYWEAASEAEAQLLLRREERARDALERAVAANDGDHAALATTRRQLRLVCGLTGIDPAILSVLAGPLVAHFCGHRIADSGKDGRFPASAEPEVAERIAAEADRHPPGYAYGSLASGGDILWAEALLERGCDLHVVLPFVVEEFVRQSVAPSGEEWVNRFHRCLAAAKDVKYATDDAFLDDDVLYRYGAELAMGLALLRARYLDAEARQFALWDGGPALGEAGTAIDVEAWRRRGRATSILAPEGQAAGAQIAPASPAEERSGRVVRAMLFADVKGFSKLTDEELPRFVDRVLGAFARILDDYAEAVQHQNTWGDALYVVVTDAPTAAACALELQSAMTRLDLEAEGLPSHLALRLGAHIGPVFPTHDPVLDELAFMGSHVSRTARIEPVTPPGAVYVTEPFAAALALDGSDEFDCDYVGHMPAAKDFGRLRMYRLRSRTPRPMSDAGRSTIMRDE